MKLSNINWQSGERVLKDGDFECLGYMQSNVVGSLLSFYESRKYKKLLNDKISCIICQEKYLQDLPSGIQGIVISDSPMYSFWYLHNMIDENNSFGDTVIGEGCQISEHACIADKGVVIGNHVIIEEHVSIKENTKICDNVIIRAGSVIGGIGHYFKRFGSKILFVQHHGGVLIEDNVEIQQLCSIHRAIFPWENTVIGHDSKLGDYVHIGHECTIGSDCFITGKSLVCGASKIGDHVWIGPNSVIKNCVDIGNNAYIALGSTVRKCIGDDMAFFNEKTMSVEKFNALNSITM